MILTDSSDRAGQQLRQGPPQPAQAKPARGCDLMFQNPDLAIGSLRANAQKWLATLVRPALRPLDGRDVDVVSTRSRRKRNRNREGRYLAGRDLARNRSPLTLQDEEIGLGIEKLPAQRKILGLPRLAGSVFDTQVNFQHG